MENGEEIRSHRVIAVCSFCFGATVTLSINDSFAVYLGIALMITSCLLYAETVKSDK